MPVVVKTEPGEIVRDAETQKRFEKELARLKEEAEPRVEAIRESQRLSDADYVIRINTLG